jgi:hypothetical protein
MLTSRNNQEVNAALRRPLWTKAPAQPQATDKPAERNQQTEEAPEELIETHPASQEFLSTLSN